MKLIVSALLFALSFICKAQGIKFEQGLSWNEIKSKAKKENKYIFVDCYATWCGPCKLMDKNTYSSASVGNVYNGKFISVKMQVDKTDDDEPAIKSMYKTAEAFTNDYAVTVLPTFLFFSPDGIALHKSNGYKNATSFIELGHEALDSNKQYYRLLREYKPGVLDTSALKELAPKYTVKGVELVDKLVLDYLSRIPSQDRFSSANVSFLSQFYAAPGLQNLVYEYLSGLKKTDFIKRPNSTLAIAFCNENNTKVQQLCVGYLKSLTKSEFGDSINLKFSASLVSIPEVQTILTDYLKSLSGKRFLKATSTGYMRNTLRLPSFQEVTADYIAKLPIRQLALADNQQLALFDRKNDRVKTKVRQYIADLKGKDLEKKELIKFITAFTTSTSEPGFMLFSRNKEKIDNIMETPDYSDNTIMFLIDKELIHDSFEEGLKGADIPWSDLENKIRAKYSQADAYRIVLNSKVFFYGKMIGKDRRYTYPTYFKYANEWTDKYGYPNASQGALLNDIAWGIFVKSDDSLQIGAAIKLMEQFVKHDQTPMYIDTYANLLYKAGRVEEALAWEKKAGSSFQSTWDKMLKGVPTWK